MNYILRLLDRRTRYNTRFVMRKKYDKKVTIDLDACKAKSDEMIAASAAAKTKRK